MSSPRLRRAHSIPSWRAAERAPRKGGMKRGAVSTLHVLLLGTRSARRDYDPELQSRQSRGRGPAAGPAGLGALQKQPTSPSLRIFTRRRDRAPGRLLGAVTEASVPGPRIWLPQAQVEGHTFPRKQQTQPSWPVERKPGLCAFHLEETESGSPGSGPHGSVCGALFTTVPACSLSRLRAGGQLRGLAPRGPGTAR